MQAALFFYVYAGSYLSEIELRLFMELNQVLVKFTSWRLSFFYNCRGMCGKLFLNVEHDEQLIIKHRIIKTDFMFSDYHAFETTLKWKQTRCSQLITAVYKVPVYIRTPTITSSTSLWVLLLLLLLILLLPLSKPPLVLVSLLPSVTIVLLLFLLLLLMMSMMMTMMINVVLHWVHSVTTA